MPTLVFANTGSPDGAADGSAGGWKPVVQDGDVAPSEGVTKSSTKEGETDNAAIRLKPRVKKKKPKTPYAGTELGIGQPQVRTQNFGGDPAKYKQPYTPWKDESTGEYRYAPGDPGSGGQPMFASAEYPLAGYDDQQAYKGYDGYRGELVWMSPDDFLRFAGSSGFEGDSEGLEKLREKFKAGTPLDFLVLELNADSYMDNAEHKEPVRVVGHEGRHRAVVAKELGITSVPVLLYPLSYRVPRWSPEFREVLEHRDFRPQVHGQLVFADDTLYQDDLADGVGTGFPAPQGGSDFSEDTNLTPRQRPRPTRTDDRTKRALVRMKHWTGLPEPPATQNAGNDAMTYPIGGHLRRDARGWQVRAAGALDGVFYGYPEPRRPQQATVKGKTVTIYPFLTSITLNEGDAEPELLMLFYLQPGKDDAMEVRADDYQFGYTDQKAGEELFGSASVPQDVADDFFNHLPDDVVDAARQQLATPGAAPEKAKAKPEAPAEAPADDLADSRKAEKQARTALSQAKTTHYREAAERWKQRSERARQSDASRDEKIKKGRAQAYNVLTDPTLDGLAGGEMLPTEKLFTTIKKWPADGTFNADPSKLDSATLDLLEQNKKGEGNYFSWLYFSPEDAQQEMVKQSEAGKMVVERTPILMVRRKPAWEQEQPKVMEKRKEFLGSNA